MKTIIEKYIKNGEIAYASYFWPREDEISNDDWKKEMFNLLEKEFGHEDFAIKVSW